MTKQKNKVMPVDKSEDCVCRNDGCFFTTKHDRT